MKKKRRLRARLPGVVCERALSVSERIWHGQGLFRDEAFFSLPKLARIVYSAPTEGVCAVVGAFRSCV